MGSFSDLLKEQVPFSYKELLSFIVKNKNVLKALCWS